MKKKTNKSQTDDMLPEYDFSKGVRGKYYRSLEKGYSVRISNEDSTVTELDVLIHEARKQAIEAGLNQIDIRAAIAKARKRKLGD